MYKTNTSCRHCRSVIPQGLGGSILQSLLSHIPVDNFKESVDIVWTHVPIVHIICMLPNINTYNRDQSGSRFEWILTLIIRDVDISYHQTEENENLTYLVRTSSNFEPVAFLVVPKPRPSTSLNTHSSRCH